MNKLLLIATFFILTANNLQAQQYDTYGRSQATREWQETERHYNSMNSNSKSTSSGNNRQVTKEDINSSLKNIELLFGLNKKSRVMSAAETAEYERWQLEEKKRQEEIRINQLKTQKIKDDAIRLEVYNNFTQHWQVAISTNYSEELREKAFEKCFDFDYKIINKLKKDGEYYGLSDERKKTILKFENSVERTRRQKAIFYVQSKQFEKVGWFNSDLSTDGISQSEIIQFLNFYIYAKFIMQKNPERLVLEKSAYIYETSPNIYLNLYAYALFLDKKIDIVADVIQKHIAKFPIDTSRHIGYINKLILLKITQGNDAEALQLYNSNSSVPITEKNKLLEFIAFNICSGINKAIAANERSLYYIFSSSYLMDIDLLASLMPDNKFVQNLRNKLGEQIKCKRLQSPISELWSNVDSNNINTH